MPHQAPVAAARWWLPVACAALLLLTWGGALDAPFVADDFAHARHALGAERLHDLRISLTGSWHGQGPPWYFRPLAVLSFFADAALYGTHATGWHATSFLLFLASALLLAGATRAVFVRLGLEEALAARAGTIAALSFCVLPSQLEAIAWISNRDGPIATVFGLAALWCWTAGRRGAGALAAALALCAKETAVTWVVLIVALDGLHAWRCAPRGSRAGALRRSLPLAGVLALYFAARFAMFRRLGSGQEQVLAEALGAGGLLHLALNVLAWLRQFPWPVADDLLGAAAVPAGVACAALACAPWLLACLEAWLDGGRPRQDAPRRGVLPAALVGGVAAAVILLGPIVFVTAPDGDLRSSRFTPLVALPLCAASGLAWAVALGGGFRRLALGLLALLLALHVAVGALHAASFALAARDLDVVRETVLSGVERGSIPAGLGAPVMLLDPPAFGPAEFTLMNVFHDMLEPPFADSSLSIRMLTHDELSTARLLPGFAAMFEQGVVFLPGSPPPAPARPLEALADRLGSWPRLGVTAPRLVRREQPAAPGAPDLSAPFDALDVAALRVEDHGGQPPETLRVAWTGTRGSGTADFVCRRRPAILPLEGELRWLASGTVTSLKVTSAGAPVTGLTPLPRLPEIMIREPRPALVLGADPGAPLDIAFKPPFPCARYRFRVVVQLALLTDTFDAGQLSVDVRGGVHLRFERGAAGGRRTTIDWRFVRPWVGAVPVRWFVEGLDGDGRGQRVVARSAIQDVKRK